MQELVFKLSNSTSNKVHVNDFFDEIKQVDGIVFEPLHTEKGIERSIETIIIVFLSSSALVMVAKALRDFVIRKKIDVEITNDSGSKVKLKAQGGDLDEVSDIIGYFTGNLKNEREKRTEEITFDKPIRLSVKIERPE